MYCGHKGCFIADIYEVGDVNVINAGRPVDLRTLFREPSALAVATHHMSDFPNAGFWRPRKGIFVVPAVQVKELCLHRP